jgi:hypothetical protein
LVPEDVFKNLIAAKDARFDVLGGELQAGGQDEKNVEAVFHGRLNHGHNKSGLFVSIKQRFLLQI